MKKGKFGIVLPFYAVAAICLAVFGQIIPLVLLTGFVIAAEKEEWASRQCLQALIALGFTYAYSFLIEIIEKPFDWMQVYINVDGLNTFIYQYDKFFNFTSSIFSVLVKVLLVISLFGVIKGKDAKILGASKIADWAYGLVAPKAPVQAAPMQQAPAAPMQQAAFQQPQMQAQAPVSAANADAVKTCPNCGKAVTAGAFCDSCGTKLK